MTEATAREALRLPSGLRASRSKKLPLETLRRDYERITQLIEGSSELKAMAKLNQLERLIADYQRLKRILKGVRLG